LVGLRS